MRPLMEESSNTAGRKRKSYAEEDDSVVEGIAADWQAAKVKKRSKTNYNSLAPPQTWQESDPGLQEDDLRGCTLQRTSHSVNQPNPELDRTDAMATRQKYKADPTQLPPKRKGKKLKYYGVLFGVKRGIYYSWDAAEPQVKGFSNAVYISSTEATEIEDFMNHEPGNCRWAICAGRCYDLERPQEIAAATSAPSTAAESSPLGLPQETTIATSVPPLAVEAPPLGLPHINSPSRLMDIVPEPVCNCGRSEYMDEPTVQCASAPTCEIGTYHKKCVGLASRKETTGWRCVACRPLPSSIRSTSSYQQATPITNEYQIPQRPPPVSSACINPLLSAEPEPPLHPEQEDVVQCIMQGKNVFYTGSAGVGKSTVLKNFVSRLRKQEKKIDIIAPSGIAALNVGGMTTYSYAGWTPNTFKEPLDEILKDAHGQKVRKRLCKTDVLVIDEISMVDRDMFIRLDLIMRESRHGWRDPENPREKPLSNHSRFAPFGGVQLVVTGDFCQLPPVKPFQFCLHCGGDVLPDHNKQDGRPLTCPKCSTTFRDEDKWAFRCDNWTHCEFSYFELKHIHRQSDIQFICILQKCRYDEELLPSEKELLMKPKHDPPGAVQLLPKRKEVDEVNASKFRLLQGAIREYECHDVFSWRNTDEPELKKKGRPRYPDHPDGPLEALKDHRYEEVIELRVGMLVILLCNLSFPDGLVNGSQGKIIGFEPYDPSKPVVPKPRDTSPTRSGKAGKEHPHHLERVDFQDAQIREFILKAKSKEWPIVQFANGITMPIYAQCPINEVGIDKPYSLLARTQIPLVAAWAITIHKSQGLSLDKVIVNLQNTFEREQIYVALSRARSLEGLKVIKLPHDRDRGRNREVAEFLRTIFGRGTASQAGRGENHWSNGGQ